MAYKLGKTSKKNLVGVHPVLAFCVIEAIKRSTQDFTVFEGLRTIATQKANVKKGVSWTLKSNHLTGGALDLIPYESGRGVSWNYHEEFKEVSLAMKSVILEYALPIEWGYDLWGKDAGHWQMAYGHRDWITPKQASTILRSMA